MKMSGSEVETGDHLPPVTETDFSPAESGRPDSLTIPTELISDETLRWILVTKYTTRDTVQSSLVQSQVSCFEKISYCTLHAYIKIKLKITLKSLFHFK